jgi:hypothetical protein
MPLPMHPVAADRHPYTKMTTERATGLSSAVVALAGEQYVNPQWVALQNLLEVNVDYERSAGAELFTRDGRRCVKARGQNLTHC